MRSKPGPAHPPPTAYPIARQSQARCLLSGSVSQTVLWYESRCRFAMAPNSNRTCGHTTPGVPHSNQILYCANSCTHDVLIPRRAWPFLETSCQMYLPLERKRKSRRKHSLNCTDYVEALGCTQAECVLSG